MYSDYFNFIFRNKIYNSIISFYQFTNVFIFKFYNNFTSSWHFMKYFYSLIYPLAFVHIIPNLR